MRKLIPVFLALTPLLAAGSDAPVGPTAAEGTVKSVYDGDTFTMVSGDKIRLKWANTPEVRPMEPFAEEARAETESFVLGGKTVHLGIDPSNSRDSYGRVLADVRTDAGDLSVDLLEKGLAHVYIVPPLDGDPKPYLEAQGKARASGIGIWSTDRYKGTLHITSFHANGQGDETRDPNLEYVRACNITNDPVDLGGYVMTTIGGDKYTLPAISVPAGYTVKVYSGKGTDKSNPAAQIEVYLQHDGPVWDNRHDRVTLLDAQGKLVDTREHLVGSH